MAVFERPARHRTQVRRAGLRARALEPICFFNYIPNSPNNLFSPYIIRLSWQAGFR
ncbi:MAG: hypothetical protein JRJ79_12095 [Deltaproteobacteria bacterium]|nr:hypothetical protein [Deltaproteobacteria bacterium]